MPRSTPPPASRTSPPPSSQTRCAMAALWMPHRPARPAEERGRAAVRAGQRLRTGRATSRGAIAELVAGIEARERDQVLLGVTGSGKTFTMAKVIEATQRPALVLAHNKTLAAQLYSEFKSLLPEQRRRVLRLLLRLLPARSLRRPHRHLHREGFVAERADRPHAPLGDAGDPGARRRDRRRLGVVHLRHRLGGDLHRHDLHRQRRRQDRREAADGRPGGPAVQAQRPGLRARHLPPARRHHRDLPRPLRGPGLAHHACSATRSRRSPSSTR